MILYAKNGVQGPKGHCWIDVVLHAFAIGEGWGVRLVEYALSAAGDSEKLARLRTASRRLTIVAFDASGDPVIREGLNGTRAASTPRETLNFALDYKQPINHPDDFHAAISYVDPVGGGGGHGGVRAVRALAEGLGVRDLGIGRGIDAQAESVEGSTRKCMAVCENGHWTLAVLNVS